MPHIIDRDLAGESINLVLDDDIHVQGKIDGGSQVSLTSRTGSITVDGKIDGSSSANLTAQGDIRIGATGDGGNRKIDGSSTATLTSHAGRIRIDGKIDGSSHVTLSSEGEIRIGAHGAADDRKIDGNSEVTANSLRGDVLIDGKIDNNSKVQLSAAGDVEIGRHGDFGDRKIDNNCDVRIRAGGRILLGDKIDGDSVVDLRACEGIEIIGKIDGESMVRMAIARGSIRVRDKIGNRRTRVRFWPEDSLTVDGGIHDASVTTEDWAGTDWRCFSGEDRTGSLIRDWGWTFGFVTPSRMVPRSREELIKIIRGLRPGHRAKARGGGWSFGDCVLPLTSQDEVDRVSLLKRGEREVHDFRRVLEGLDRFRRRPVDLHPNTFQRAYDTGRSYNQPNLREDVASGADLPSTDERYVVIDTRGLASSLQTQLEKVLTANARQRVERQDKHYFWVEAGITITALNTLLDHQKPRLAIQASGGSPGATLAGTLATATHGGEFRWPLLVDMVRAIHLVGPGGEEWWIEGKEAIADFEAIQGLYPRIDPEHFIAGAWSGLDDLLAADVLNAVIVSLGTMGVVYSVILEVVDQYGIEQRTVAIDSWQALLQLAQTSEDELREDNVAANQRVLDLLIDGRANGSGVDKDDNVYIDLAINPINRACWVINRRITDRLPTDPNPLAVGFDSYLSSADQMLSRNASTTSVAHFFRSALAGRIHDFLHYGTSVTDIPNNIGQIQRLLSFITSRPPIMATGLATLNVQAVLNEARGRASNRGQQFLADVLDTVLHALQGTGQGQVASTTGVSHLVGAIGWPDDGIPGRGIEVALSPDKAFSYLQKIIFDQVIEKSMIEENQPLIGYISIRVCPATNTFMGMQQHAPYSVMIELVGLRTPEANAVMNEVQSRTLQANREDNLNAMLHWGLEHDQLQAADLDHMPVTKPLASNPGYRQIDAVRDIRRLFLKGHEPVFDNNFVRRLSL